jgi:hypothetical protein
LLPALVDAVGRLRLPGLKETFVKRTPFMQRSNPLKWFLALTLALGLVACGGDDEDQVTTTAPRTFMSGEQEVPPVVTGAIGTATFSLELPSRLVRGSLTVNGMTATAAHIHQGAVGVSGPIIVPMVETAPGTWSVPEGSTLTPSQVDAFVSGDLYFNAHSTANPNGEIRGQIGREVFISRMSPAQEVPPPASSASGVGRMVLNPLTRKFTASITVSGTAANAAHIHAAGPGVNGPIIFPFTETAPGSGVWVAAADATLSDAQLTQLRDGGLYFNAHSTAFPGGEIRGQIARDVGVARLSGAEEVPPTGSAATGTATLIIDPMSRAASGSLTVSGINANAAHVHIGAPGVNGPIIVPLTSTSPNVWTVPPNTTLSADNYKAYKQGNLYFNAHSIQFPNGEIRGQIR